MSKTKRNFLAILVLIVAVIAIICHESYVTKKADNLCITEVCPHNEKAAHDEYGYYDSDYIEVYNPTERTVNLSGYGLSDDSSELSKFLFPDINIEPGKAIIVWSSEDKYPKELWRDDYVPSDVHGLGFNISDGEACILTDPDGKIISTALVPQYLEKNTTIAASQADLKSYVVDEPTPYYVKGEIVVSEERKLLDEPVFSIDGGWFDKPVTLELSSGEGEIYYTLDGTDPDENSLKYEGPITIDNRSDEDNYYLNIGGVTPIIDYAPDFKVDKGTVVKAVAISDTGKSDIATNTFFVGLGAEEYAGVSVMSLVVSPEDFFDYVNGIYVVGSVNETFLGKVNRDLINLSAPAANYAREGKGWERDVEIEYFNPEHERVLQQDAGIRIHGGFSVDYKQKSFNLYAREEYDGSQYFNTDFYGNGYRYNKIVLRNGGLEDAYLGKMRDVFNQSLATDRAVGVQEAIPCVVFLNGEYWGLYNLQEKACDNYVWNHYGVPEDDVAIVKLKYKEYVATDDEDAAYVDEFKELVDFVTGNDMSIDENYRYVESRIDIQSLIDCYVLKLYTGCIDAYFHNEIMWRSKTIGSGEYQDGKWRFLVNDLDNTDYLNGGHNSPDVDSLIEMNWDTERGPLVDEGLLSSLVANPEFKERFVASFMDMMDNNFSYEEVAGKLWSRANVVRTQTIKSQQVFWDGTLPDGYPGSDEIEMPFDENDFGYDIGLIDAFFRERAEYMKGYLERDLN